MDRHTHAIHGGSPSITDGALLLRSCQYDRGQYDHVLNGRLIRESLILEILCWTAHLKQAYAAAGGSQFSCSISLIASSERHENSYAC